MYKFCVFAGTTEGRELVSFLCGQGAEVVACAASEYGGALLPGGERLRVSARPMPRQEIEDMLRREGFDLVIDATHPYAVHITESVAAACAAAGTEYIRLLRPEGERRGETVCADSVEAAAAFLDGTEGNILLTTGSKDIGGFSGIAHFRDRVYARVLPREDSLRQCLEAGLLPAHIMAMQGPFSREMNAAMLRSVNAAWLVTKDGGAAGGFEEKAAAAAEAGIGLVVIGRPPQREGLSYGALLRLLRERYGFTVRPWVTVAGIGPGGRASMTEEVRAAIDAADCVVGASRMLEPVRPGQAECEAVLPGDIAAFIHEHPEYSRYAVVMSGDTGFFSGTKKLLPLLGDCDVTVLPGLSSLAVLCARLRTSYEDVYPVSLHGRDRDIVADVRRHRRVFALVGGENGAGRLCRRLTEGGCGEARVSVGERLSYPDERITVGTAGELAERSFAPLSAVLIENGGAGAVVTHGLPDGAFLRQEGVPMTKSEVRAVCLSKLALTRDAVCWDIGAGTGSVAVEMALQAESGEVWAIERRTDAAALIGENAARLGASNVRVVQGEAPEACRELPPPTHAFIGGSAGNMAEIISLLLERNPHVRIAAAAVTLETVSELTACLERFGFDDAEVTALNAAQSRKAGAYHLMTARNPVHIFVMQRRETT